MKWNNKQCWQIWCVIEQDPEEQQRPPRQMAIDYVRKWLGPWGPQAEPGAQIDALECLAAHLDEAGRKTLGDKVRRLAEELHAPNSNDPMKHFVEMYNNCLRSFSEKFEAAKFERGDLFVVCDPQFDEPYVLTEQGVERRCPLCLAKLPKYHALRLRTGRPLRPVGYVLHVPRSALEQIGAPDHEHEKVDPADWWKLTKFVSRRTQAL